MAPRKQPASVTCYYDGKAVDMSYVPDPKRRFAFGCMRVTDNTTHGFVVEGDKVYEVSRAFRSARIVTGPMRDAVLAEIAALAVPK